MSKKLSVILILIVMFLWGSLYPVLKVGNNVYHVQGVASSLLFAGIRFSISGAGLLIFAFITRKKATLLTIKESGVQVVMVGVFAIILHYGFLYVGLQTAQPTMTSILKQVGSLFFVCFSWMFFKDEKFSIKKLVGVLLGFVGVAVTSVSDSGFSFKIGDLLTVFASFFLVFSDIISKKIAPKSDPVAVTAGSQFIGGVVLLVAGFVMGGKVYIGFNLDLWVIIYICFASVFSYTLWYTIMRKGNLSNLLIIRFSVPIFSSILSCLLLRENIFQWQYAVSFVLICLGIYISNLKSKKKTEKAEIESAEIAQTKVEQTEIESAEIKQAK
ncbi:MAG: DMT family transporter [Clostridia bacterium]|nr:DMT family transporter [Clostridia bacterium]